MGDNYFITGKQSMMPAFYPYEVSAILGSAIRTGRSFRNLRNHSIALGDVFAICGSTVLRLNDASCIR